MTSAILDPTGGQRTAERVPLALAPRRQSLAQAKVGLLENGKQNARLFLEEVAAALRAQHGAGEALVRRKAVFTAPAPPELIDELSESCDVVVIGIGDCGSCSASAVADGILFERHGTPAAVICSEAFTVTADAMAEVQGVRGYRYLTTPHPVAGLTPEQVRQRAEAIAPAVAAMLTAARAQAA